MVDVYFAEAASTLRKAAGGSEVTAPDAPPGRTVGTPATPARASGLGYTLTFYDDFSTLDTTVWRRAGSNSFSGDDGTTNDGANQELEWYHPDNTYVSDGMLHLRAEKTPFTATRLTYDGDSRFAHLERSADNHPIYPYRSGMVSTKPDLDNGVTGAVFGPGCFVEAEVNIPSAMGTWPAFWQMPHPSQFWPAGGEIDWFEHVGDKQWDGNPGLTSRDNITCNLHYSAIDGITNGPYGFKRSSGTTTFPGVSFSQGWHRIGGLRLSDRVEYWLDGVKWHEIVSSDKAPQTDMYLIFNLAIGGYWPGSPDAHADRQMPFEMMVNYVAVWS